MPRHWMFTAQAKPEVLKQPFECCCVCHPIMQRPKVWRDRRCEPCWQDSAMTWSEFLIALDEEAKVSA